MSAIAYVAALPLCDFCKTDDNVERPAQYDAKTVYGPWANMCEGHYEINKAHHSLGTGLGQKLIVGKKPESTTKNEEISAAMRNGDLDAVMDLIGDGDVADWL